MAEQFNAAEFLVDRHVAEGRGERLALRSEGIDYTYAELQDLVARTGAAFLRLGARREERVVFFMADTAELAASILGAFRVGMTAAPINTMLRADELGGILNDARPRIVVTTPEFADTAAEATAATDAVTHLVVVGGATPAVPDHVELVHWQDLVPDTAPAPLAETSDDYPALWLYTSGTTGFPKGAMHRHANIRHVYETYAKQVLGITPEDRFLSVAKLFFAYGIGNGLLFPLAAGATTILEPRKASPASIGERAAQDEVTLLGGVPTFFGAMLGAETPPDQLATVRLATSAGEALPAPLQTRWTERYGVPILDGLGSTEALHIFLSNRPDDIRPGTTGYPVPGYELDIRDFDGNSVPDGTPGTLYLKGESLATGYWCRTDATREVFQGSWLVTGDTYVRDTDGYFTSMGRTSDLIKAGGIWVSPGEVEARLLEHDAVQAAAVVGAPDADGLIKPAGSVVLHDGASATPDELIEFCRETMAHFKAPRTIRIVDELPRTATGKLQRFKVRTSFEGDGDATEPSTGA